MSAVRRSRNPNLRERQANNILLICAIRSQDTLKRWSWTVTLMVSASAAITCLLAVAFKRLLKEGRSKPATLRLLAGRHQPNWSAVVLQSGWTLRATALGIRRGKFGFSSPNVCQKRILLEPPPGLLKRWQTWSRAASPGPACMEASGICLPLGCRGNSCSFFNTPLLLRLQPPGSVTSCSEATVQAGMWQMRRIGGPLCIHPGGPLHKPRPVPVMSDNQEPSNT